MIVSGQKSRGYLKDVRKEVLRCFHSNLSQLRLRSANRLIILVIMLPLATRKQWSEEPYALAMRKQVSTRSFKSVIVNTFQHVGLIILPAEEHQVCIRFT